MFYKSCGTGTFLNLSTMRYLSDNETTSQLAILALLNEELYEHSNSYFLVAFGRVELCCYITLSNTLKTFREKPTILFTDPKKSGYWC